MAKGNNRNMRFSDEMIEMIESQQGENFTKKFENLVTRCMWELPAKEKEIKRLDKEIAKRQQLLKKLGFKLEDELGKAFELAKHLNGTIHMLDETL